MNRREFAEVMAYLGLGIGRELSADAHQVYFDLLGDLPAPVLRLAAKRVLLEHRWANFPTVAELRAAATETARGEVKELSPGEAWALAWAAVGRIDPEVEGSEVRATKGLPPAVAESLRAMGVAALCYGDEPVGVVRGQFMKVYEAVAGRRRREALLPLAVRQELRVVGEKRAPLPAPVKLALAGVGKAVPE